MRASFLSGVEELRGVLHKDLIEGLCRRGTPDSGKSERFQKYLGTDFWGWGLSGTQGLWGNHPV